MARDAIAGAEDFVARSEAVLVRKEQDLEVRFQALSVNEVSVAAR